MVNNVRYRIVQTRIRNYDESKYNETDEKPEHPTPNTMEVVARFKSDETYAQRMRANPVWNCSYGSGPWPETEENGWITYSYHLEGFNVISKKWEHICYVDPHDQENDCD
jgi:hypothetical protein